MTSLAHAVLSIVEVTVPAHTILPLAYLTQIVRGTGGATVHSYIRASIAGVVACGAGLLPRNQVVPERANALPR